MNFFTFLSTEISPLWHWKAVTWVVFFFLSLSLLGFFFINIDLNLKSKPQLLAVSYRKHKPSHLQSLAANPSELALSQLGEKDIL